MPYFSAGINNTRVQVDMETTDYFLAGDCFFNAAETGRTLTVIRALGGSNTTVMAAAVFHP